MTRRLDAAHDPDDDPLLQGMGTRAGGRRAHDHGSDSGGADADALDGTMAELGGLRGKRRGGGQSDVPPALREGEEGPEAPLQERLQLERGDEDESEGGAVHDSDADLMQVPGRRAPAAFSDPDVPMSALSAGAGGGHLGALAEALGAGGGGGGGGAGGAGQAGEKQGATRKEKVEKMEKAIEKLKHMRVAMQKQGPAAAGGPSPGAGGERADEEAEAVGS